jgi:hypothetical protein
MTVNFAKLPELLRGRNWRPKPSIEGTSASQRKRRLGWFTAVAEAARLAGCSRQRLHEACRSYAEFSIRNAARRGCSLGPYDGTLSDQMQMRRWGRAEAKPMSRDLTAPRAEYLAKVWRAWSLAMTARSRASASSSKPSSTPSTTRVVDTASPSAPATPARRRRRLP